MPVHLIPSPQSNDPVEIKEKKRRRRKKMWQLKPRKGIIRKDIYEYEDPTTLTPRQQILWYQKHRHVLEQVNEAEVDSYMNSNASGCDIVKTENNPLNSSIKKKVLKRNKTIKTESRISKQIGKIHKGKLPETNRSLQIDVYKHIKRKQELQLIKKSLQEKNNPVEQDIQNNITNETQRMGKNIWNDFVSSIKKNLEIVEIKKNVNECVILEDNANLQKHILNEINYKTFDSDSSRNKSLRQEKNIMNQKQEIRNLSKADFEYIKNGCQNGENTRHIKKQNIIDKQDINASIAKNDSDSGLFSYKQCSDCFDSTDLSFCDIKIIESQKNKSIMQILHDTTSLIDMTMHEKNSAKEKDYIISTNNNKYEESCNIKKSILVSSVKKQILSLKRLKKQHECVFKNIIYMEKIKLKNSNKVPLKVTANMTNYLTKSLCCCNELRIGK